MVIFPILILIVLKMIGTFSLIPFTSVISSSFAIVIQQYFSVSCVGLFQVTIVRDFPSERIVNQLLDPKLFSWFTIF
jgi:hypothetical protein